MIRNKPGQRILRFQNPYNSTVSIVNTIDSINGLSVKDWRTRMAHGQDASTPYSRDGRKVFIRSGGNWYTNFQERVNSSSPWNAVRTYGHGHLLFNALPPSFSVPPNVENSARSKFVAAMRSVRQTMDGTTFLAEIHKTLHQMRHPLDSLRRGISDYLTLANKRGAAALTTATLRRGAYLASRSNRRQSGSRNTVRARALTDALTGTYLEFQFGIRPTLFDLQDAHEALLRQSGHLLNHSRVEGKAGWSLQVPDNTLYEDSNWVLSGPYRLGPVSNGRVGVTRKVEVVGKVSFTGCVAFEQHEPSLRKEFGFTPENFIPSLWELFPWSWAFDYAINVDDYLSAFTASYADVMWANRSVYTRTTETWHSSKIYGIPANSANIQYLGNLEASPSIVEVVRRSYSRAPIEATVASFAPIWPFTAPSAVHLLNLASAVWQARKVGEDLNRRLRI